jgi:hypothetical protein
MGNTMFGAPAAALLCGAVTMKKYQPKEEPQKEEDHA